MKTIFDAAAQAGIVLEGIDEAVPATGLGYGVVVDQSDVVVGTRRRITDAEVAAAANRGWPAARAR